MHIHWLRLNPTRLPFITMSGKTVDLPTSWLGSSFPCLDLLLLNANAGEVGRFIEFIADRDVLPHLVTRALAFVADDLRAQPDASRYYDLFQVHIHPLGLIRG